MGLTVFTSRTNPQIVIFHQKTWAESGIRIKCLGEKAVHRLHKRKEAGTWSREREAGCSHKAHSSLLGWTTRLTRPHFIMRIGMLLCHLSLCSSYIIVRGFKSLFYRRAVETKQYLCITVDFCHLPSAVYLLLIRKNQVGWTPAHTGEMDRWGMNCEKHAKKNKEKKEKMFDGRGVLKQELMIMVLWWERCV